MSSNTAEDKPHFNTSIFTKPATDLASSLTRRPAKSSPSPTRSAAARTRAMSITEEWKPIVDRRQSWSAQEYSHEMHSKLVQTHDQRGSIGDRLVERDNGQGFSER